MCLIALINADMLDKYLQEKPLCIQCVLFLFPFFLFMLFLCVLKWSFCLSLERNLIAPLS